jgi:hypothetical protein
MNSLKNQYQYMYQKLAPSLCCAGVKVGAESVPTSFSPSPSSKHPLDPHSLPHAQITGSIAIRGQPPRPEAVTKLRVACMDVLATALGWQTFRCVLGGGKGGGGARASGAPGPGRMACVAAP